jgi:hypothetical protein
MIPNEIDTTITGQNSYRLKFNIQGYYKGSCYFLESPFGNCQTFSIKFFDKLLENCKDENILQHVLEFSTREDISCKQLAIDVHAVYKTRIEKIFADNKFLVKQEYENSNGTAMLLCLIKLY